MIENVCKFLPKSNNYNFFNIINLVYENTATADAPLKSAATFRMIMVVGGEGLLVTERRERALCVGDIVVMRPARPFAIRNTKGIRYIYISYLGGRANLLADEMKIEPDGSIYSGYERLIPLWKTALEREAPTTNLCCEGVVLYSFAELGDRFFAKSKLKSADSAAERIRIYIEDNFADSSLSLESVAEALSYSPKYVSATFKKELGVTFGEYLRTIRIQYACELMEEGITSLKTLAPLCGYEDPLYFSSVFKRHMGRSPREHIKNR